MRLPFVVAAALSCAPLAGAQEPAPQPSPASSPAAHWQESVQVTATRIPESVRDVPAAIDVISGDDLRQRGASNLREALALAAGVEVAPGGDGGPASSVPEFWGLKEFDAFLLVVDGVPWGGAFNPALASLDLKNVDRVEVQRGAAPVMYGATSFVGVVQVVRRAPAQVQDEASLYAGSYDTGGGALSARLPGGSASWASAISADFTRQGFKDDRTSFRRGHLLWRTSHSSAHGLWHFDADGTWLDQDPASPHVRQGKVLSPITPLDGNYNPLGARLDEKRLFFGGGYDRVASFGSWNTTVSFTHSGQDVLRGFLADVSTDSPNANGFEAKIDSNDVYFDSHVAFTRSARYKGVLGADYLYGKGDAEGNIFSYFVNLDGSGAPAESQLALGEDLGVGDTRNFAGLYAFGEWNPTARLKFEGGLRLNHTEEKRGEGEADAGLAGSEAKQDNTRLSGSAAAGFTLWERGAERLGAFAAYKNTFKPAAVDFNLVEGEAESGVLKPETAQSIEGGLQADLAGGRGRLEVSAFLMDLDNLVISQAVNGLPGLTNAGQERFKGLETSLSWRLPREVWLRGTYAWHDARFRDFLTEFDGQPTQLSGKRLEMSAHHLASGAIVRAPAHGLVASLEGRYVGQLYLNKRNTAPADGYATFDASLGWRTARYELRAFGRNLGDKRNPVAESELGDAQYYRMTARRFDVLASVRF